MLKVVKLIEENDKNKKRNNDLLKYVKMENIFDITKTDVNWLYQEDKELYNLQVKSRDKIGYVTSGCSTNRPCISLSKCENLLYNLNQTLFSLLMKMTHQ